MNTRQRTAQGTGRRKSSIAQIKLTKGTGQVQINNKPGLKYLQENVYLMDKLQAPLAYLELNKDMDLKIQVTGGGLVGQADAMKLGIARALCVWSTDFRSPLKAKGYLTRDARVKERKKYGLKKARKAPQYSKR